MKTIKVKLYSFDELSEEAKEKAIEKNNDINVDYDWWDYVYDDFGNLCRALNIDVDLKKTWFNGFYCQGSGSSFNASFDVIDTVQAIKAKKHFEYAPKDAPDLSLPDIDKRVLKLLEDQIIDADIIIKDCNRETSVQAYLYCYFTNNAVNVQNEIDKLEYWGQEIADELNNWLYRTLEKEYEYLTSEESIAETLRINAYDFTEDGEMY